MKKSGPAKNAKAKKKVSPKTETHHDDSVATEKQENKEVVESM